MSDRTRRPKAKQWRIVLDFYEERCAYCGIVPLYTPNGMPIYEIDHVVPYSLFGGSYIWNYVPACKNCNRYKSVYVWKPRELHPYMLPWDWYEAQIPKALYEPDGAEKRRDWMIQLENKIKADITAEFGEDAYQLALTQLSQRWL